MNKIVKNNYNFLIDEIWKIISKYFWISKSLIRKLSWIYIVSDSERSLKRQSLIAKFTINFLFVSNKIKNIFTKEYNLYLPKKEDFKKQLESLSLTELGYE